jgi:MoaA/NifB/PqqE/SkfB family radical SAM enzyme
LGQSLEHCNNCLNCGNLGKAYKALSQGFKFSPGNPVLLSQRGRIALLQKNHDQALADFQAATRHQPEIALAYSGLALYHLQLKNLAEAEVAADRALALDPNDGDAAHVKEKIRALRPIPSGVAIRENPTVRVLVCVPENPGNVAQVITQRLRDPYARLEIVCLLDPDEPMPELKRHFQNEPRVSFRDLPAAREPIALRNFFNELSDGVLLLWQSGERNAIHDSLPDPRPRTIEPEDLVDYHVPEDNAGATPAAPPDYLLIQLTNRCHYRCFFCCVEDIRLDHSLRDLPIDKFYSLQSAIETAGIIDLSSAGEVLLYPHIREAMAFVAKHNRRSGFQFTTTGALLTEELIRPVASRIDQLTVSLNASNPATYERDMGARLWERVLANIRTMRGLLGRDKITVGFVAHGKNIHELPDLVRLAAKLDVWHLRIAPLFLTKPEFVGQSLWFCKEKAQAVIEEAKAIGKKCGVIVSNIQESVQQMSSSAGQACMMPTWGAFIDRRGNVGARCYSRPHVMGNVFQGDSFEKVWNGKKYRALRKHLYFRHCRECPNLQPDMNRLDRHIDAGALAEARKRLPLISVVIPAPATVEQARAAISSLKNQTYSIWEAIFVVNPEHQDIIKAVETAARTDSRIRHVPTDPGPVQENAKRPSEHALTSLIRRMNPTAPFEPDYLEVLLKNVIQFDPNAATPTAAAPSLLPPLEIKPTTTPNQSYAKH